MAFWTRDSATALLRSAQLLFRRAEIAAVRRDTATGGWVHRYRAGTLVSPVPRGVPWRTAERNTRDLSFHRYEPKLGDTILEIGAEFGTETVSLSRAVGPTGRVIAIEAHPYTCELLSKTVELNHLENVIVLNLAVVDAQRSMTITDDVESTVANSVMTNEAGGILVAGITIDEIVRRYSISRIDLLKMNIEGAEGLAILGMEKSHHIVKNAVISCHDFRADQGGDEIFRTSKEVESRLRAWNFEIERRVDDPRPWVRDYRYAKPSGRR